jgi:hypothetical protein
MQIKVTIDDLKLATSQCHVYEEAMTVLTADSRKLHEKLIVLEEKHAIEVIDYQTQIRLIADTRTLHEEALVVLQEKHAIEVTDYQTQSRLVADTRKLHEASLIVLQEKHTAEVIGYQTQVSPIHPSLICL